MKKILVLYQELAGYNFAAFKKLVQLYPVQLHIVHKDINTSEAPFQFQPGENIFLYNRKRFAGKELSSFSKELNPGMIFCGGWNDKEYLQVTKFFFRKIPTLLGFDTPWEGKPKQHIATVLGRFYFSKIFSHCFVPGERQYAYAKKLGFTANKIFKDAYTCDVDLFHAVYERYKNDKARNFPKKFLYVARYNKVKGLVDLWDAFIQLQEENPNEWELWCLGAGDIAPVVHPKILHFGFVQPEKLEQYIKDTGIYVLPSHFEPWGVAVHECAAAAMPLICSNKVGAATVFLKDNFNGFVHEAKNIASLKSAMKKAMSLSGEELNRMSGRSAELAGQITPETWAATFMKIINSQ